MWLSDNKIYLEMSNGTWLVSETDPNFNSAAIEVWEWMTNFIPHFTGLVITYAYWDWG